MVNAVRNDLGIGLRGKVVAQARQLLAQLFVILDDAVVDDGEPIARDMRMRIALAGNSVCRPASVRNPDLAGGRSLLERVVEHLHLANGAQARQMARAVQHRDAGRIVAAILEPPQALHQNGDDIAFGDRSDNSTHDCPP